MSALFVLSDAVSTFFLFPHFLFLPKERETQTKILAKDYRTFHFSRFFCITQFSDVCPDGQVMLFVSLTVMSYGFAAT